MMCGALENRVPEWRALQSSLQREALCLCELRSRIDGPRDSEQRNSSLTVNEWRNPKIGAVGVLYNPPRVQLARRPFCYRVSYTSQFNFSQLW